MKNIHVLPTDKPSRLFEDDLQLYYSKDKNRIGSIISNKNIYITSDEEIKDVRPHKGKWQLEKGQILNQFPDYLTDLSECKLVIMTTDPQLIADGVQAIDDEFLEWFVKNPSCESVEVEKFHGVNTSIAEVNAVSGDGSLNWEGKSDLRDYKIIIPKEEFKNSNNLQGSIIDSSTENNSFYLPKEKRVMVKFNDDEPMHINSIYGIGNFIISLKEGENIKFQNNGKTFELYIETT
jgi:hypothetical protein